MQKQRGGRVPSGSVRAFVADGIYNWCCVYENSPWGWATKQSPACEGEKRRSLVRTYAASSNLLHSAALSKMQHSMVNCVSPARFLQYMGCGQEPVPEAAWKQTVWQKQWEHVDHHLCDCAGERQPTRALPAQDGSLSTSPLWGSARRCWCIFQKSFVQICCFSLGKLFLLGAYFSVSSCLVCWRTCHLQCRDCSYLKFARWLAWGRFTLGWCLQIFQPYQEQSYRSIRGGLTLCLLRPAVTYLGAI